MKIYIAGKITGLDRAQVIQKFEAAEKELQEKGHKTFIPSVLPAYQEVSHEDYLHICFSIIDVCDAIYLLSDWEQSKGALLEYEYAKEHEKKILFQRPNLYQKFITKEYPQEIQRRLDDIFSDARSSDEGLFKVGFYVSRILGKRETFD